MNFFRNLKAKLVGIFPKPSFGKTSDMNSADRRNSGFTLIELMVVVAIMILITSVVIFNYNKFNSTTLITNYAYEVAFAIREAQIFGLSVRGQNNNFQVGYGIHLSKNDSTQIGTKAFFTLFADVPAGTNTVGDRQYITPTTDYPLAPSSGSEFVKYFTFAGNYRVEKFCVEPASGGTERCSNGSSPITSLDITFIRPNPDAYIIASGDTVLLNSSPNNYAEITIISPSGESRKKVVVYSSGQISIQSVPN